MQNSNVKGLGMVMTSAALYGLMPLLAKLSYAEGLNVISVLFYRYLLAFIMITAFVVIKRVNLRIKLSQLLPLGIAATVGTLLTTYTLFLSYDHISTGLASTLHFVYPIFTTILAIIIYREKFTLSKGMALLLSFAGITFLTISGDLNANFEGVFWALASGVFYAIYIIIVSHKSLKEVSPYSVAFYVFGITTVILYLWGHFSGQINYPISGKALFYISNLSFWATFVTVILFFAGVQITGPSNASILSTFEPLTGVLLGIIIFQEELSMPMMVGCLLVIASVVIIARNKPQVQH